MLWLLILPLLVIPAYGDADCDATAFVQSSVEGLVKPHAAPLKAEAKAKAKTQAAPAACKDMIKAIGRGINIGNTYDMKQDERSPMEVQKRVRWIKDQGFQHLRLPVTWGDRFDSSSLLTKNVTEVVDYALELGLYVVINTHHEMWLKDHYDGSEQFNSKFWKLWHDIAVHFQDRDRRLIFEILNEPEHKFGSWGGGQWPHPFDENAIRLTKEINNVGYDAVRQVSKDRMVFVSPNAQASKGTASSVYPNLDSLPGGGHDECLGVEVHTYDPWAFAGDTGQNSFYGTIPQMKKGLYDEFRSLHEWQFTSNVPLYVGEFGVGRRECCQGERNAEIVKEYYRFAMHHFLSNDWAACAWDDPGWFAIYHKAEEMHGKGEGIHDYLVKGY